MSHKYEEEYVIESDSDHESDIDLDVESSIDDSDASVKRVTRQQYEEKMKLLDPDYYVINKRVGKKMKRIQIYSTGCNPGRRIRNPMLGFKSNDRVGTLAEHSYFKIRMTTIGNGVEPVTLYYDSPDTYEKHLHTKVSFEIKKAWRDRFTNN